MRVSTLGLGMAWAWLGLGHGTLNQCCEAVQLKCWLWPVADETSIACLVSSAKPLLHMITGQCVHHWLAGPHCHAHPMQDAGHRASRTCFVAWPLQDITNKTEIIHHTVLHHTTSSQVGVGLAGWQTASPASHLAGFLSDWLAVWRACWLTGLLADWQGGWLAGWMAWLAGIFEFVFSRSGSSVWVTSPILFFTQRIHKIGIPCTPNTTI